MKAEFREHLLCLAHALEPLMMLAVDAQHAVPLGAKGLVDGLLRIQLQLTRYQVWLLDEANRGSP
jgi:hypothetical protein